MTARSIRARAFFSVAVALALPAMPPAPAPAAHVSGAGATYTDDADFDEGRFINVAHPSPGQLQLDETTEPFDFIWVAVSSKGTVVKIDTRTGAVKGEYLTSPDGRGRDPSRTTIDKHGNVWLTNRAEGSSVPASGLLRSGPSGSLVRVGLLENDQCIDRNGNGVIDTSTGYGDVRLWTNTGGADTLGGVATAEDECVLNYVRVNSTGTRHVSVTRDNDVWVSGTGERAFDLIDGDSGSIVRTEVGINCGGYGGLIDANGVIWSARPLLRWDTSLALTAANARCYTHDSYGLAIDPAGNVWNTQLGGNAVRKIAPDGTVLGTFAHGAGSAQGVVADRRGRIWVAHSLFGPATVGQLRNDGTFVGNVNVGGNPTGVAVDGAGKVWATNHNTATVTRIDPDAANGVGLADLETRELGGTLYNYSDMTGSVLSGAPTFGTWTVVHDGGSPGSSWETVSWNADEPSDSDISVSVAASESPTSFGRATSVSSGGPLQIGAGRYLKVVVTFLRATSGESPVLHDLTIGRKAAALEAHPATMQVEPPDAPSLHLSLAATLTDAVTGLPLGDRAIEFSGINPVSGEKARICEGTTDETGTARCSGPADIAAAIAGSGYEAKFAGDFLYAGAVDEGAVIRVDAAVPRAGAQQLERSRR